MGTYYKRSSTTKQVEEEYKSKGIVSTQPKNIARVSHSPEYPIQTEQEDFGFNDTDERVTSNKKATIQRNIDWRHEGRRVIKKCK
jgi:hypothetical protein